MSGSGRDLSFEGRTIGHLRFGERLGEGGMGTVYAAVDDRLKRDVAVKILRRRTGDERRRLLAEARALSRLDHPRVCRVYDLVEDVAQAPDGEAVSMLVLERVEGTTLDRWLAARHKVGVPARADLLAVAEQIAEALAAAHAEGIVHRDLKPGNVMIDEAGRVKVLDFGLARPVSLAGTLLGADDRHALDTSDALDALDELPDAVSVDLDPDSDSSARDASPTYWRSVDGRTEGVVGTPAYMSPEQARGEQVTAASDIYSLGLLLHELFGGASAYGKKVRSPLLVNLVAQGKTQLLTGVDADLVDLVERMKSSAAAARPSAREVLDRLRQFAAAPRRRRRAALAAAVALAILGATVKYTVDVRRERDLALAARDEAEAVTELMLDVFGAPNPLAAEWSADPPPWQAGGDDPVTAREVLDHGVTEIEQSIHDRPQVRARLLTAVGKAYGGIGEFDHGIELLGSTAESLAQMQGAEAQRADVLQALGDVAVAGTRYEEAEAAYRSALEIRRELGDEVGAAGCLEGIAYLKSIHEPDPEAESLLLEALDILSRHPEVGAMRPMSLRLTLGWNAHIRGDYAVAEERFETLLADLEAIVPEQHPAIAVTLHGYGETLRKLRRLDEAESALRRSYEINRAVLGERHPRVGINHTALAGVLRRQGRYGEAETHLRTALEIARSRDAPAPSIASILSSLTVLQNSIGRGDEATANARDAHRMYIDAYGADSYASLISAYNLATALRSAGQYDEAGRLLDHVVETGVSALGEEAALVKSARIQRAMLALDLGDPATAEAEALRVLGGEPQGAGGPEDPHTMALLGISRARLGRVEEGRELLEASADQLLEQVGPAALETRQALGYLLALYEDQGLADTPDARRYRGRLAEGEEVAFEAGSSTAPSNPTPSSTDPPTGGSANGT